jgi:phenylacetate-CoA ligase
MPFPVAKNLSFLTRHLVRRNPFALARARNLVARELWPVEQLMARQESLLRTTLASARRLPRYAHIAEAPGNVAIRDWLSATHPVISKPDLVSGRGNFYPNEGKRRPWWAPGKTSGSSGTPLEVFRSIDSIIWEEAFQLQFWHWAGHKNGQAQAILRGDQVIDISQQDAQPWLWDRFGKQLLVSTRHLSRATAEGMLDSIARAGARQLRAYPSSAFELARAAERLAHPLRLRAVVTGSEPVYPAQREQIERAFGCKVFDFYGMAERIAFAGQCEHGYYHLHPEYSYVEILDQHDQPTDDFGYVVGTTLHNHVMPLVRYRIADRARWVPGACPCGRHYPRIELSSGKVEDQLYDSEGTPISAGIITFAVKFLTNIQKTQVAQVGPGQWQLRVVPDQGYTSADGLALREHFNKYVSLKVAADIVLVDDLALQSSGKFKWIVQEWSGAKALSETP